MKVIKPKEVCKEIKDYWKPYKVANINSHKIQFAKVKGEFVMHNHEKEDEMFYVIEGKLFIEFESETKQINKGEMIVIPAGINHKPYSEIETHIMLIEPDTTINTGNITNEFTIT